MGSPLAPILANFFMGFHERNWLDDNSNTTLLFYRRYVDDTFCIFNNETQAMTFFNFLKVPLTPNFLLF